MRIAMLASECEPFAKTGGLGDVVDALSRALGRLGHDVEVFLPRYRGVEPPAGSREQAIEVLGRPVRLVSGAADGYTIRLVDEPESFDRAGLYGESGADYADNAARFALLGRTALAALAGEGGADLLHGHDWQSGPGLLALRRAAVRPPARAEALTCHNLAYHGWVPLDAVDQLGPGLGLRAGDGVDLLREGIRTADMVTTVSPTFAQESLTPEVGAGLDPDLRAKGDRYIGILNGIDTVLWDPANDPALPTPFSADLPDGKARARADLVERLGLDAGEGPLIGIVGRLDPQKGFDLVAPAGERVLATGASLVVLGTGDATLVTGLRALADRNPSRVVVIDRFDRDEARRIYGGSDLFLMPSRFEPCGQGQMIALRYGSIPVVRRTGGLADTVLDADADAERGNGFVFGPAEPDALADAVERAAAAYRDPARWRALVERGMTMDFSWERPARQYVDLYERALAVAEAAARPS